MTAGHADPIAADRSAAGRSRVDHADVVHSGTGPAAALRRAAARARWWWRELSGESVYDRYVAHTRRCSPDAPVMTRREFERSRTNARECDPREGFRCC